MEKLVDDLLQLLGLIGAVALLREFVRGYLPRVKPAIRLAPLRAEAGFISPQAA